MSGTDMPDFFGLLYIADAGERPVNLKSARDPIDIYVACATTCAASFRAQGYAFTLVTNDAGRVQQRLDALGLAGLPVREHAFGWQIPEGIAFRSAHYKLELFEAFGSGGFGDHVGLVDIDTALIAPLPRALIEAEGLVGYDITATEISDYGETVIADAVSAVAGEPRPASWWGGEFLLGHAADFRLLSDYVARLWPDYVRQAATLHHQGDEAVTGAAISLMHRDGHVVHDAGTGGGVARWWSARTATPHPPLRTALARSLLHLPADKPFLGGWAHRRFDPAAFAAALRREARRKIWLRRAASLADRIAGRPGRAVPRL